LITLSSIVQKRLSGHSDSEIIPNNETDTSNLNFKERDRKQP